MAKFVNIDGLKPIKVFLSAYAEEPILVYKKEDIDRRTAADVAPVVHGHWSEENLGLVSLYRCSKCGNKGGAYIYPLEFKYCPDCGARMDEEEQDK